LLLDDEGYGESNGLLYACGSDDTCGPDVRGFAVAGVFENFGNDVGKGAGEGMVEAVKERTAVGPGRMSWLHFLFRLEAQLSVDAIISRNK